MSDKLAIVVFNLGGPDSPAAVRPFLFNLFNDRRIVALPQPLRWLIATTISVSRAKKSQGYYARLGGRSVLLDETEAQAAALTAAMKAYAANARVFVYMRYWHPMAREVVAQLKLYGPDRIVVLPLYPQFSTTTTETSLVALSEEAARQGLIVPFESLCCYPTTEGFIGPQTELIRGVYDEMTREGERPRILFSAHGLPQKTIDRGDPYQWQVEQTVAAIRTRLGLAELDSAICYQSRVGPVAWIGPSIEQEIARAGKDGVALIVAPIAFVSEHVETLVELDETMKDLAAAHGVPRYARVPTVRTDRQFIAALAAFSEFLEGRKSPCSATGERICPAAFGACPMKSGSAAVLEVKRGAMGIDL